MTKFTILILALSLAACAVETPPDPAPADPCVAPAEACEAACPANVEGAWAQHESCVASCGGTFSACEQGSLTCVRVDSEPHGCASSGCWATLACNRDPSVEMGLTCSALEGGRFACAW